MDRSPCLIGEASVGLVHVLDPRGQEVSGWPYVSARPDVNDPTAYPTIQAYAESTERWLTGLSRDLRKRERVTVGILVGVPGEEIIAAARRTDADLIIGRRGRARTLPPVLGSTVSTVLRQAPCPVFVVADPPDAVFDSWAPQK
jgi:nucleotide-binding universal stress UspA family protein